MANWYKIGCKLGHQGTGNSLDTANYVFADDVMDALDKYRKHAHGVKKQFTPDISSLSPEDSLTLEERIRKSGFPLHEAKRTCFYGYRR